MREVAVVDEGRAILSRLAGGSKTVENVEVEPL